MAMCKCHPDGTFCPDMICVDFVDDVPVFERRDTPEGKAAVARLEAAEKARAWRDMEAMAREINPNLPADLSGYQITISLSKDRQTATAAPVSYK